MIKLNAWRLLQRIGAKALHVPIGGWHAHTFAEHGETMLLALVRVALLVQRRAMRELARLTAQHFREQLEAVIAEALRGKSVQIGNRSFVIEGYSAYDPLQITIEHTGQEQLWANAINKVMADQGLAISAEVLPVIQSVMGQAYSKTNLLLGLEGRDVASEIARKARGLALKITRIDDTTRDQFETIIRGSIEDGLSVIETAQRLREQFPEMSSHRHLMIARTESNNAWTQGTAAALKEAETLSHVSIIACQAREPTSPQYHGESTCNYEDLPVGEIDPFLEVGFHINHTGTMVPSRFRKADGTAGDGPRPAILDEQSQAEGAE